MITHEIEELSRLHSTDTLRKDELLVILKRVADKLDIQKIMKATNFLREDARFMQSPYREEYVERFSKAFFTRVKDLKDDKGDYKGEVDIFKLKHFLKIQNEMLRQAKSVDEKCFLKIALVISLYTTFVREESIHPVGTKFPGGFKLRLIEGSYLCPVKERQLNNPSALCQFCVSVQDEDV